MAFTIGNRLLPFRGAGLDLPGPFRPDFGDGIFILFTSPIWTAYSIREEADVGYQCRQR